MRCMCFCFLQKPATPALGTMFQRLSPEFLQWFEKRGISAETLRRNGVAMEMKGDVAHIAHPFYKDGNIVNVKYRQLEKKFHQTKGGEQIMYGYDDAKVLLLSANCYKLLSAAR